MAAGLGAFQINILISTKEQLLAARRASARTVPMDRGRYPAAQSLVSGHAALYRAVGRPRHGLWRRPGKILPSPTGYVPGLPSPHGHGHEGDEGSHHREVSGKVNGIVYDHFGDFEGFIIETSHDEARRFHSREQRVLNLFRKVLEERIRTTVIRERDDMPLSIVLTAP